MSGATQTIDSFFSEYLGCDVGEIGQGEIRIVASDRRCRREMGYASILAVWILIGGNRCAVSVQPPLLELVPRVDLEKYRCLGFQASLARKASDALDRELTISCGPVFYCTPESFRAQRLHPCHLVVADDLPSLTGIVGDYHGLDDSIREGTCFAAMYNGKPVSVSGTHAVPHLAHVIADMNVPGTLEAYRGQGFGTTAVSATTEVILAQGKIPVYMTSDNNAASIRIAKSVGYLEYGWQLRLSYCPEYREGPNDESPDIVL